MKNKAGFVCRLAAACAIALLSACGGIDDVEENSGSASVARLPGIIRNHYKSQVFDLRVDSCATELKQSQVFYAQYGLEILDRRAGLLSPIEGGGVTIEDIYVEVYDGPLVDADFVPIPGGKGGEFRATDNSGRLIDSFRVPAHLRNTDDYSYLRFAYISRPGENARSIRIYFPNNVRRVHETGYWEGGQFFWQTMHKVGVGDSKTKTICLQDSSMFTATGEYKADVAEVVVSERFSQPSCASHQSQFVRSSLHVTDSDAAFDLDLTKFAFRSSVSTNASDTNFEHCNANCATSEDSATWDYSTPVGVDIEAVVWTVPGVAPNLGVVGFYKGYLKHFYAQSYIWNRHFFDETNAVYHSRRFSENSYGLASEIKERIPSSVPSLDVDAAVNGVVKNEQRYCFEPHPLDLAENPK